MHEAERNDICMHVPYYYFPDVYGRRYLELVVSIKKSICISAQCKTSKVSERFIAKRRAENAKSYKDALLFFKFQKYTVYENI